MSVPTITPTLLYRTSATIFAILIPGHILMGFTKVHPALKRLAATSKTFRTKANNQEQLALDEKQGIRGAQNSWNAWNAFAGVMGKPIQYQEFDRG